MKRPLAIVLPLVLAGSTSAWGETPPSAPARTLETITIEGAVEVPQVLFITSRDNARFDDGLGWSYLPTIDEILADLTLPVSVRPENFAVETDPADLSAVAEPAPPAAKE